MGRIGDQGYDMSGIGILSKEYYGYDLGIYNIDGSLGAYDGLTLIKAFVLKRWSDIQFINKIKRCDNPNFNDFITNYKLPLTYYEQLLDEYPLGQQPLDALVTLG